MEWNKEIQSYFKSQNVEITLYPSGAVKKFSSIERFHAYYSVELENWSKQSDHFDEIKIFYKRIIDTTNAATDEKDMNQAKIQIDIAISLAQENIFPNLSFSSTLAKFFIELSKISNNPLSHLFAYLKTPSNIDMPRIFRWGINFNYLIKMILLIENNSTSSSKINSLVKIHEDFLLEAETDYKETRIKLNDDIEIRKQANERSIAQIGEWRNETQQNTDTFLNEKKRN